MAEARVEEGEHELGMLQKHRQHITNNIEKLINSTDYNVIVSETVRRGLITTRMRSIMEDLEGRQFDMTEEQVLRTVHENYFKKIMTRGPTAYAELKAILKKLGFLEALEILQQIDPPEDELPCVSLSRHHNNTSNHNNNNNNNSSYNNNRSSDIVDTRVCDVPPGEQSSSVIRKEIMAYNDANEPITPFTEPILGQTRKVRKSEHIHKDEVVDTYKMETQHNRGVLFIVNIVDFPEKRIRRNGADNDGAALIHIFRQMDFTIFSYKNLEQDEFFKTLDILTSSEYVRATESFVMVLMTHGERVKEVDKVQFTNGSFCDVKNIIKHFQPDVCPNLIDKPKVLMFPFCRGDRPDQGKTVSKIKAKMRVQTDGVPFDNVPTLSDLLICYASTPGFETHRDPEMGSWYIQCFCDTMADHAHNTSLEDILKKTQASVGKKRTGRGHLQTGAYDNLGFNKKLYFNPGIFTK